MTLEDGKTYIQKNPLFGRKMLRLDRIRESIWGWSLCDITLVTIDKEPAIMKLHSVASSIYEHQGLEEIPERVFQKTESLVRMLEVTSRVPDEQLQIARRQETLGKIIEMLTDYGIINDDTYDTASLKRYAAEYERYSQQQMEHVTDVIDVHK